MPTVAVNPPKTPVTKGSGGIATAAVPNVCKMPGPPAPFVPTPLPNIGTSDDSPSGYSTSVTIEGNAVAIKGATFKSKGDIASKGTGGGIVSANTEGPTEFAAPGSMDVKIEGQNVHLLGDATMNNCGSPPNASAPATMQSPTVVLPVLEFDKNDFREKTANMQKGMPPGKNEMQLTRNGPKSAIRAKRRAALKFATKGPPGTSLDEFPFASAKEIAPPQAVSPIDSKEQNRQGGKMSSFYQKHNLKPGDPFIVKIV